MKVKILSAPITTNGNKEETQAGRDDLIGKEIDLELPNEGYTKSWYNLVGTSFWWPKDWLESVF